jgi:hypothetical protein
MERTASSILGLRNDSTYQYSHQDLRSDRTHDPLSFPSFSTRILTSFTRMTLVSSLFVSAVSLPD